MLPFLVASFIALSSRPALATETIVVTATRSATPSDRVASAHSVVDPKDLDNQESRDASSWLQALPGVQVRSSGGPGQTQSLYIRGGNADHTLVLIDGIVANDQMTTSGSYDFSNLDAWAWEKAEIIRGPQSGMYGSQAMAGVVQFFSLVPDPKEPEAALRVEAGNYDTHLFQARWGKKYKSGYAAVSASHQDSLGFSAANKIYGNTESDGSTRNRFSAKIGKDVDQNTELSLATHFFNSSNDLDTQGGANGDAVAYKVNAHSVLSRAELKRLWLQDSLETKAGFSLVESNRDYEAPYSYFDSVTKKLDLAQVWHASEKNTFSVGADSQWESGTASDFSNAKNDYMRGIYAEHQWSSDQLFWSMSLRHDWFQNYDRKLTFRLAPGISFFDGQSILHGSYGSAFKSPSLYQTYSSYGSISLLPEESKAWDLGLNQNLGSPDWKLELDYFFQRYTNLITSNPTTFKSQNLGAAKTWGWEAGLSTIPLSHWKLNTSATRLFSEDASKGRRLVRRPDWSEKTSLTWTPHQSLELAISQLYIGQRDDAEPDTGATKTMPSYQLFGLNVLWSFNKTWSAGARLENVFDKNYEDVAGYGTAGRSFYAHIQATL